MLFLFACSFSRYLYTRIEMLLWQIIKIISTSYPSVTGNQKSSILLSIEIKFNDTTIQNSYSWNMNICPGTKTFLCELNILDQVKVGVAGKTLTVKSYSF